MNPAQVISHFDRISDAPDAIPRLRRFILDLAVRGKLVGQDPRDEPAVELLKRIQEEKARLVREGETRREQPLPPIGIQEVPSENPDNWKLARLGDTSTLITKGSTPTSYGHAFVPSGINFIKVESIKDGRLVSENVTSFISEQTHNFLARSRLAPGDILFSIAGSIGACARVTPSILPANTNQALAIIRGTNLVFDAEFLLICLKSSIAHLVLAKARGGAMNNVSLDDIRNLVVPIPPLDEQHRIVAKVDELMALCDRLEAAQAEHESQRDRLVASSLNRLNNGADADAFHDHARFYFNHLPRLTTRAEHIQQLRQTILNLAVRGKLAPQDPTDEPASELLRRIQAEKQRLMKAGILSQRKVAAIEPKQPELDCWKYWQSVNFIDVCNLVTSGSRGWAEFYSDTGPKFIRAQNIRFGRLRLEDLACVRLPKKTEGTRTQISKGDLLIVITGAGVTNPAMLDHDLGEAYVSQHVALIKPTITSLSRWLLLCLMAPVGARAELVERAYGAGKPGLNLDNIRFLRIPLPPLAEQQRIVAKVDELMALCDKLEVQLTTTHTDSRRLLGVVLHDALAT